MSSQKTTDKEATKTATPAATTAIITEQDYSLSDSVPWVYPTFQKSRSKIKSGRFIIDAGVDWVAVKDFYKCSIRGILRLRIKSCRIAIKFLFQNVYWRKYTKGYHCGYKTLQKVLAMKKPPCSNWWKTHVPVHVDGTIYYASDYDEVYLRHSCEYWERTIAENETKICKRIVFCFLSKTKGLGPFIAQKIIKEAYVYGIYIPFL
jgi:hypothetical protein